MIAMKLPLARFFSIQFVALLASALSSQIASAAETDNAGKISVTLMDGSIIHGATTLKSLEVETAYGKLTVPLSDIARIRFGRLPNPELQSRIAKLIEQLGDRDFQSREAVSAELAKIGAPARKPLEAALRSTDAEVVTRAQQLLESVGAEQDAQPLADEMDTREFSLRGRIKLDTLEVATPHGTLKIARKDLRTASITTERGPGWMTDGLVAHWKLDEQSGDVARDEGQGKLDGRLEGFADRARCWGAGVSGNALVFDGAQSCVLIPKSEETLNPRKRDWTIAVWVKTRASTSASGQVIIAKNGGGQNAHGADRDLPLRIINDGGRVVFGPSGPHFGVDIIGTTNVNDDKWHHIVGVRAGKTLGLFIDGKLEAETTDPRVPEDIASRQPVYLGRNDLWDGWAHARFNGSMDDVRIYSRALTAEEIKTLAGNR